MSTVHPAPVTVTIDVTRVCRVCLRDNSNQLIDIFETPNGPYVLHDVYRLYDISVMKNDKISKMICLYCITRLTRWRTLLNEITSNQQILHYFHNKTDSSVSSDVSEALASLSKSQLMFDVGTEEKQIHSLMMQGIAKQETAKQETAKQETATHETATQETATQEAATQEAATQETATQEAATQEIAIQETSTQDTSTQDTSTQDTSTQDTSTQETATQETAFERKKIPKMKALNVECLVCRPGTGKHNKKKAHSTEELKKLFCAKHRKPFACPVTDCSMLFPFKRSFIHHYRNHLGLDKNSFLCHTCFEVLDSPRYAKKGGSHVCQSIDKLLICCSESFRTMIEFVFHKLNNHCETVAIVKCPQQSKDLPHTPNNQMSLVLQNSRTDSPNKDKNLFTCLVPHCDKVFNEKRINLKHFKEHSNIHSNVCSVCLCICALQDCLSLGGKCKHKNQNIFCTLCNKHFQTLEKFALHKLYKHGSIITCGNYSCNGCPVCGMIFEKGSEIDTSSHYKECYKKKSSNEIKLSHKPLMIKTEVLEIKQNLEKRKTMAGTLKCLQCDFHFDYLSYYISHVKKIHKTTMVRKESDIKLCPICDHNYLNDDYTNHVSLCTRTMKISDTSFGCVYCKSIFSGMTDGQFRKHFMFCKSIQRVLVHNSVKYYKCKNCTFMSSDEEISTSHAVTYCIYRQLMMKYARNFNEKLEISMPELNPNCSNLAPTPLENKYRFMCKNCDHGFYSEYIFKEHMQLDGSNCRPNDLTYCQTCQLDFDSEFEFINHCSPPPPGIPFGTKLEPLSPVKQEMDDEDVLLTYQSNVLCKPEPETEEYDGSLYQPGPSYVNTYENQIPENNEPSTSYINTYENQILENNEPGPSYINTYENQISENNDEMIITVEELKQED